MWFGEVDLDAAAEGALLAHTYRLPGRVLGKGQALTAQRIAMLRGAGHRTVLVARLDAHDVAENAAADRVARCTAGSGVRWSRALTGRCNLHAVHRGVLDFEASRVHALNQLGGEITLATALPDALVEPGELVGTVKIIPFGVSAEKVAQGEAVAAEPVPLMRVSALQLQRVALVVSHLGPQRTGRDARAIDAQKARLGHLGAQLERVVPCQHRREAVAMALGRALAEDVDLVLFLGASATVDRADVFPWALESVGGTVDHVGMPVDPGNLLVVGHSGPRMVLGVPGCARSLKPSGFDRVLRRCLAKLPVTADSVARMGVGGVLTESRSAAAAPRPAVPGGDHTVGGIVLAAGQSSRMGTRPKLLAPIDGEPMVRHVVRALAGAGVDPIVVVTGHAAGPVREALAGLPCRFRHNAQPESGMGGSLALGAASVEGVDAVVVALADMPDVTASHVRQVIQAWHDTPASIAVPTFRRQRGHPVLFAAEHIPALRRCSGDVGARAVVAEDPDRVCTVEVGDDAILRDIDTPEDLDGRQGRAVR